MAVEALDEVRVTSPEPQENFWVMEVHRKTSNFFLMSVIPREIFQPGPFPITEMRNGQNRDSGNRGSDRCTALRSIRGVQ